MNNEIIVESIKNLCKNNNISASQLEKAIGLSQGLISKWAKTTPSLEKITDIADYFHVSIDEVVGHSKSNIKPNKLFINSVIYATKNRDLIWNTDIMFNKDYKIIKDHDDCIDFNCYPTHQRKKHIFVSEYNNGFFTLQSYIIQDNNAIINSDCAFYIQADKGIEPVYQECEQEQLLQLTKSIISSIYGDTPEDLANEFKANFEKNYRSRK